MRLDVTTVLQNYDGSPLLLDTMPVTVRSMLLDVLNATQPGEDQPSADKAMVYDLSVRIARQDEVELSLDERSFIKRRTELLARPVVMGQLLPLLEG